MTRSNAQLQSMTVGEIAAQIPGATAVFRRHGLDFCCAGNKLFEEAISQNGLNPEAILGEMAALSMDANNSANDKGTPAAVDLDDAALIQLIVSRYHDVHRLQFPELIQLAGRVEKVHAAHPLCPQGLEQHLITMFEELSEHMEKEETVLFPMIARGNRQFAAGPITVMMNEHEDHGRALMKIRALTHEGDLPPTACNTWRALYRGLFQLEEDLMQHIHLENNILFVR